MPTSNTERQRRYRERHLNSLDAEAERINMIVNLQAKRALQRLAHYWGMTQRATLERVLAEAQSRVLDDLGDTDQNLFYDQKLNETDVTQ